MATLIPEIIPVIEPILHWQELLDNFNTVANKKLTATVDASPIKFSEPAIALISLYEIRAHVADPIHVLRYCLPYVGQYLNYGFLVLVSDPETLAILKAYTQLNIIYTTTGDKTLGVICASLCIWQSSIVHCCTQVINKETRLLLNLIMLWFEKKGLGNIFDGYVKVNMDDQSFKLEYKK